MTKRAFEIVADCGDALIQWLKDGNNETDLAGVMSAPNIRFCMLSQSSEPPAGGD